MTHQAGYATRKEASASADASMHAYRVLRDALHLAEGEKDELKQYLLVGKNPVWAWFALHNLRGVFDSQEQGKLCTIISNSKDGEMMLWTLDEPNLSIGQRNALIDSLIALGITSWAHIALDTVENLSDTQRQRLERVSRGMAPIE